MIVLQVLAVVLGSYLLGAIPFGLLVVCIANGKDVRKIESGRTGGTNAMRAAGFLAGLITAALDVLKGAATAWVVSWLMPGYAWLQVLAAVMAIVGHNHSIFLRIKDPNGQVRLGGGAGGAPALGGAIALWSQAWLIVLPVGVLVYLLVGYASLTTISVTVVSTLIFAYRAAVGLSPWEYVLYGVLSGVVVVWALRPNLQRLRAGNERPVGLRAYLQKKAQSQSLPTTAEKSLES